MFDQGKIVERGSFEELVALNGRFAALARAQFMASEAKPEQPEESDADAWEALKETWLQVPASDAGA